MKNPLPIYRFGRTLFFSLLAVVAVACSAGAQSSPGSGKENGKGGQKKTPPFRWVNPLPNQAKDIPGLQHHTFHSEKNGTDIGYLILLPPGYDDSANQNKRYPVVYYLHGGRPGSEMKNTAIAREIARLTRQENLPGIIYVFSNGGEVSHYDFPEKNSFGETALIQELIPHVDATYRTLPERGSRGLEGFSQGGRATGRLMFKYPELFSSAAPMGGGHGHEKDISETQGHESETLFFSNWETNSYDTARVYAKGGKQPPLKILIVFGTEDYNYEANLDWMRHLDSLGIPYENHILEGIPHSATKVYGVMGADIIRFHARNFGLIE